MLCCTARPGTNGSVNKTYCGLLFSKRYKVTVTLGRPVHFLCRWLLDDSGVFTPGRGRAAVLKQLMLMFGCLDEWVQ
jgi:hypothetical protein